MSVWIQKTLSFCPPLKASRIYRQRQVGRKEGGAEVKSCFHLHPVAQPVKTVRILEQINLHLSLLHLGSHQGSDMGSKQKVKPDPDTGIPLIIICAMSQKHEMPGITRVELR